MHLKASEVTILLPDYFGEGIEISRMTHDVDIARGHRQAPRQSTHGTRVEPVQQLKNARLSESFTIGPCWASLP